MRMIRYQWEWYGIIENDTVSLRMILYHWEWYCIIENDTVSSKLIPYHSKYCHIVQNIAISCKMILLKFWDGFSIFNTFIWKTLYFVKYLTYRRPYISWILAPKMIQRDSSKWYAFTNFHTNEHSLLSFYGNHQKQKCDKSEYNKNN